VRQTPSSKTALKYLDGVLLFWKITKAHNRS
jgi:hypothetical protein